MAENSCHVFESGFRGLDVMKFFLIFESLFLIFEPLPLNVVGFLQRSHRLSESSADGVAVPLLLLLPLGERACIAAVIKSSRERIGASDSSSKKTATGFIKFACKHKPPAGLAAAVRVSILPACCLLVIGKPLAWMDIYDRSAR